MAKIKPGIMLILLTGLLFSACGQVPAQPVSTETGTATASVTPTKTKLPTRTPTPYPTIGESYPAWWVERKATIEAQETLIAQFPGNCGAQEDQPYAASVSPDGSWLAIDCETLNEFVALNKTGTKQWVIPYSEEIGEIGEVYPGNWSPDNSHIYFGVAINKPCCMDGVPDWGEFGMSLFPYTIYRMNTLNGLWAPFIPYVNYDSFSPTGRRLAYVRRPERMPNEKTLVTISVYDLKTGEEFQYKLEDYLAAGYITWSEDGLAFAFSAVQKGTPEYVAFNYTLYKADMETHTLVKLYSAKNIEGIIFPIEWNNRNVLSVRIVNFSLKNNSTEYIDLNTNQLPPPPDL